MGCWAWWTSCSCAATRIPTVTWPPTAAARSWLPPRRASDEPADAVVLPDRRPVGRLLPARGIRLRRRHAAAVRGQRRARPLGHARHDRPGVGRQRGVAGGGRRRHLRRLPELVRGHVLGLLP